MTKKKRKWIDSLVVIICLAFFGVIVSVIVLAFSSEDIIKHVNSSKAIASSSYSEDAVCTTPIMLWEY